MVTRTKKDVEPAEEKKPARTTAKAKAAAEPDKKKPVAKKQPATKASPEKKPAAAKKAAAAPKIVASSPTALVFQAPDPALFPAWKPGAEPDEGERVVRRRSRAGRVSQTLRPSQQRPPRGRVAPPKKSEAPPGSRQSVSVAGMVAMGRDVAKV
jgi:hypothetical protein